MMRAGFRFPKVRNPPVDWRRLSEREKYEVEIQIAYEDPALEDEVNLQDAIAQAVKEIEGKPVRIYGCL